MNEGIQAPLLKFPSRLVCFLPKESQFGLIINPDIGAYTTIPIGFFNILQNIVSSDSSPNEEPFTDRFSNECLTKLIINKVIYYGNFKPEVISKLPEIPNTLYWETTKACTLRCNYCYMNGGNPGKNELKTDEVFELINQAKEMGIKNFIFTGGEPLLREDIFILSNYARKYGLITGLITNGTLIDNMNCALNIKNSFNHITISLDGSSQEYNDKHRGVGSYLKIIRAVDLLQQANTQFSINSAISNQNIEDVSNLIHLVKKYNVQSHNITTVGYLGRAINSTKSRNDWKLYIKLHRILAEKSQEKSLRFFIKENIKIKTNCGLATGEIYIDSEGNVFPCKLVTEEVFNFGNIRNNKLVEIFEKEIFKKIRKVGSLSIEECQNCFVRWFCGGGCRGFHLDESNDLFHNNDIFCKILKHRIISLLWIAEGYSKYLYRSSSYEHHFLIPNQSLIKTVDIH